MNPLALINGFSSLMGLSQGQGMGSTGANGMEQGQQLQQQPRQGQWGMEAMQQGPQLMNQVQSDLGATAPWPSGLNEAYKQQLNAEAMQAHQQMGSNFGGFYEPEMQGGGMVLPDRGAIQPQRVSVPVNAGGGAPQAMPYSSLAGGIGQTRRASERPTDEQFAAGPEASQGFNPFNFTGTANSNPNSTTPIDPNMFLRMSEGYNRGGLMGALGMLLTDYK